MLSKLTHVAFALPSLNRNTILKIESNIFNFIWGGKPDKVARDVKKLEKNGGLNFSDIFASWRAFKFSWLRRLSKSESKWAQIYLKKGES